MKKLFIIVCFIRLITNLSGIWIKDDNVYREIIFSGIYTFELYCLSFFLKQTHNKYEVMFIQFCIGSCAYSFFKLVFLDPIQVNVWEYLSLAIGLVYMITNYAYYKYIKKLL